jgi:hypothetical protein
MRINARCPNGHEINATSELAGRKINCPACQAVVTIPVPEAKLGNSTGPFAAPRAAARGQTLPLDRAKPAWSGMLIGGGVGLLVGLLLLSVTAWLFFFPGPSGSESAGTDQKPKTPKDSLDSDDLGLIEGGLEFVDTSIVDDPLALLPTDFEVPGIAWSFPGEVFACAYDARSGRLAVTNDENESVLVYDVDDLASGNPRPVGVLVTDGIPTAIHAKSLEGRTLFVVASKGSPKVSAFDAETLDLIGDGHIPREMLYASYLGGSENPVDPYIYWVSHRGPHVQGERDTGQAVGRMNLRTMVDEGLLPDLASVQYTAGGLNDRPVAHDLDLSPDGELLYYRPNRLFTYAANVNPARQLSGELRTVAADKIANLGVVTGPHGNLVSLGRAIHSRNVWNRVANAEFEVRAFFRSMPLAVGINREAFAFGSTDDFKIKSSVPIPESWWVAAKDDNRVRHRDRNLMTADKRFIRMQTDDQRRIAMMVLDNHLAIVPVGKLGIQREISLTLTNPLPRSILVNRQVRIPLITHDSRAKIEVVTEHRGDAVWGIRPIGAVQSPTGSGLRLVGPVTRQQLELKLDGVRRLQGLPLPIPLRVGEETMEINSIDAFNGTVRVSRSAPKPHNEYEDVDFPQLSPEDLPKIEDNVLSWTPSMPSLGRAVVVLRISHGDKSRDVYWDVNVEQPRIDVPFFVAGIQIGSPRRLVIWGREKQGDSRALVELDDRFGKSIVAVADLDTFKIMKQVEVEYPVVRAAIDKFGVVTINADQTISALDGDTLERTQHAPLARVPTNLQILGERFVHCDDVRFDRLEFTKKRVSSVNNSPSPSTMPAGASGVFRGAYLSDGILYDETTDRPQLVFEPFEIISQRSNPSGINVTAGSLRRYSSGFATTYWHPSPLSRMRPADVDLISRQTWRRYPADLRLNDESITAIPYLPWTKYSEDQNSLLGVSGRPTSKSLSLEANASHKPVNFTSGEGSIAIFYPQQVLVIDDQQLLPADDVPFHFAEVQSAFILNSPENQSAGDSFRVRYDAPGASRYRVRVYPTFSTATATATATGKNAEVIDLESKTGDVDIPVNLSRVAGDGFREFVAKLTREQRAEFDQDRSAFIDRYILDRSAWFESLTGEPLTGFPVPILAVAEAERGRERAGLIHWYFVLVPRDEILSP